MKTAVSILQEVMVKLGKVPEYVCIAQTGPAHRAKFEYRCKAHGLTVTAAALSKKDAKQEAARLMLSKLEECGITVPSPSAPGEAASDGEVQGEYCSLAANFNSGIAPVDATATDASPPEPSYVSLLNEFSAGHRLPAPHYELLATSGPPHCRSFTMRVSLAGHHCTVSSTTKKSARQLAAHQLYTYLKENYAEVLKQTEPADVSPGQHDELIERCLQSLRGNNSAPASGCNSWPAHIYIETARRGAVRAALETHREQAPELVLAAVAAALGLHVRRHTLHAEQNALVVLELTPGAPPLTVAARDWNACASAALRCLCRVLAFH